MLQTIESVLSQSYKDYELIVVDDGSQEDIEHLVAPYCNYLTYVRKENGGPASARNFGIRLSSGELIALLDHDDVWAKDNLKAKAELLLKNPECAMVYSYPELIDFEGNPLPQEYPSSFPHGYVFEDFLLCNRIISFSCTLIRKNIFDLVGLLDECKEITCCDDYDMWLRIADRSEIEFSGDKNVYYRLHAHNLMNNLDLSLTSHIRVFEKALRERNSIANMPKKQLSRIVNEHMYNKFKPYAYKYYYDMQNYKRTRDLLWKCLLLRPFVLKDWQYFLICLLPSSCVNALRNVTRLTRQQSTL